MANTSTNIDLMNLNREEIIVVNNTEKRRFEIKEEGHTAVAEYMISGPKIIFTHTEVPVAMEGNGLGGILARTALEYAKEKELKVMPLCPFMAGYIKRHPEWKPLLLPGFNV
jgi:predicted GNAT family acetyltransferase